jgi:hypothetical protein
MKTGILWLVFLVTVYTPAALGEGRNSSDFEGVLFECSTVPSQADPVWDILMPDPESAESAYSSSDGSLLDINVLASGSIGWALPGEYGAEYFANGTHNYSNADPDNPWNPDQSIGYTLEISSQVINSQPGTWGYCLYIGEANHGALINLQIFADRITSSDNSTTIYTGDLTGSQHKIRLVRNPGIMDDPFDSPSVDIYVDGSLVYSGGRSDEGGIMSNSAWNQDWLFMGSLAGSARYHVKTDYIRMDFTGPYEPGAGGECGDFGYLKGDFNRDCNVDIQDLVKMVEGWVLCTDPSDPACVNCSDPFFAGLCK